MTPDEIITTLAEFEGWKFGLVSKGCDPVCAVIPDSWTDVPIVDWPQNWKELIPDSFPNYLCPTTGLSHCRRVQLLLTDEQHEDFRRRLKWAIANELGESTLSDKVRRAYISASASQVAQALAATIRREGL